MVLRSGGTFQMKIQTEYLQDCLQIGHGGHPRDEIRAYCQVDPVFFVPYPTFLVMLARALWTGGITSVVFRELHSPRAQPWNASSPTRASKPSRLPYL